MAQDYDKIFKENITALLLPLAEKILNLKIRNTEPLKDKLQDTLENEADYLSFVEQEDGEKFILHMEFQTTNDPDMIERMQLYYSLLRRKYKLPIVQKVFYFGRQPMKMRNELNEHEIFKKFDLISFSQHSYKEFINSKIPEELILTVLSNFEGKDETEIIENVLGKLKETNQSQSTFDKYARQLVILSRLRGLNQTIKTLLNKMPITYNIEEDAFFKEGLQRGLQKREAELQKEKAKREHEKAKREQEKLLREKETLLREKEKEATMQNMINDGLPYAKIAAYLNVSLQRVEMVAKKLGKEE